MDNLEVPDSRCKECPNCHMVRRVKATLLHAMAKNETKGSGRDRGLADDVATIWNTTLADFPCTADGTVLQKVLDGGPLR